MFDDPYIRAQLMSQARTANDSADETIEDSEMVTLNDTLSQC